MKKFRCTVCGYVYEGDAALRNVLCVSSCQQIRRSC